MREYSAAAWEGLLERIPRLPILLRPCAQRTIRDARGCCAHADDAAAAFHRIWSETIDPIAPAPALSSYARSVALRLLLECHAEAEAATGLTILTAIEPRIAT
jgi:hypothetical protein